MRDPPPELVARVLRMTCLMRAGELAEWDRDLARCHRLLAELDRPELASMVDIVENAGHVLRGDWATAEEWVERATALRYGNSLWGPDFPRLVTLFTCRRAQGRLGELLDELATEAANPLMIPLRPLAVLAALECDDPALATELVERWGTDVRDDWVADFLFAVWGQVSARLGVPDPRTAYDRLLPYADQLLDSVT